MKIQSYKVDDYIKNIENSGIYAVLLYGPDAGLVSVRFNEIAKKILEISNNPSFTACSAKSSYFLFALLSPLIAFLRLSSNSDI